MQFTCESGRIVLCLKNHEWSKSAISSMFKQVASSADFVNTWETEITQNGIGDHRSSDTSTISSRKCSTASTETSVSCQSSNSQDGPRRSENDRSTRKRSAATSDLSPSTESDEVILCGPPSSKKQCDYMSEGIDQRIERCRKGIIMFQ